VEWIGKLYCSQSDLHDDPSPAASAEHDECDAYTCSQGGDFQRHRMRNGRPFGDFAFTCYRGKLNRRILDKAALKPLI